jgi:hypothetical protein
MKKRGVARTLGGFVITAGLVLSPSAAYSETQCEKSTDAQLRQALDQELAALEKDHTEEEDGALDHEILAALKNGHLVDFNDLEQTMADDGTTVEDVVKNAVEEADARDAPEEQAQGTPGWTPVSRRGKASRADGAIDAVKDLVEKTDEARAAQAKPRTGQ